MKYENERTYSAALRPLCVNESAKDTGHYLAEHPDAVKLNGPVPNQFVS